MKKFLPLLFFLFLSSSALFAQTIVRDISIGVRGGFLKGLHTRGGDTETALFSDGFTKIDEKAMRNSNFAVFASYEVINGASIQSELNFMFNQEIELSDPGTGNLFRISYSCLDIPVLLKLAFTEKPLTGFIAGPHLTIPLGKMNLEGPGLSGISGKTDGPGFGITTGIFAGFPFSFEHFTLGILLDARLIIDLKTPNVNFPDNTHELMSRHGFAVSGGLVVSF